MSEILFYEKPGCINNTKQKKLLRQAGHQVIDKSLLLHPWSKEELRPYFGDKPVADWFNRSAPQVKSGEVDPAVMDEETALSLMIAEPLLIRRPLVMIDDCYFVGFDAEKLSELIGLDPIASDQDLESCPRSHTATTCADAAAKKSGEAGQR